MTAPTGYLGPRGTFTHQAALDLAGDAELVPVAETVELMRQVVRGELAACVLPMDNTVNGPVMPTLDAVLRHDEVVLRADLRLPVTFDAYALDDRPQVVVSHPHALAQCQDYVASLGVPTRAVTSTAAAVEELGPGEVALAAPVCGSLYDVPVLARGVEDNAVASTHFGLFGTGAPGGASGRGHLFVLRPERNAPGVLFRLLQPLADRGVNMSNLITRPVAGSPGEYVFILFVEGTVPPAVIAELLALWDQAAGCRARHVGPLDSPPGSPPATLPEGAGLVG